MYLCVPYSVFFNQLEMYINTGAGRATESGKRAKLARDPAPVRCLSVRQPQKHSATAR